MPASTLGRIDSRLSPIRPCGRLISRRTSSPSGSGSQTVLGEVPVHVTLVGLDFDREDLAAALAVHGYLGDRQTFFIWEAVIQYLTEVGIRKTLDFLAKAACGSRLAFTYACKDFIDGQGMYGEKGIHGNYARDNLWVFGMDPQGVDRFLEPHGWRVIEHLGYEELAEQFVRPTGRELASWPLERMVYAEKV